MIIVTGCDNSGKTTLVKHISEKFNIPIAERFHPLPPRTPSDWQKWYQWVLDNLERKEEVVFDRFFIDELVYGPILRGGYSIPLNQMGELSSALLMKQPLYIYTCPGIVTIFASYGEREQYVDEGLIESVIHQFSTVNDSWPINQLRNTHRFNYIMDPEKEKVDVMVERYITKGCI